MYIDITKDNTLNDLIKYYELKETFEETTEERHRLHACVDVLKWLRWELRTRYGGDLRIMDVQGLYWDAWDVQSVINFNYSNRFELVKAYASPYKVRAVYVAQYKKRNKHDYKKPGEQENARKISEAAADNAITLIRYELHTIKSVIEYLNDGGELCDKI